jgi:phage repressor protein C with HTH and peptisase S24 domain
MDEIGPKPIRDEGAQLLEELMRFKPDGLTANGWAVKAGVSRTIWADLRRHGNPSRRTLEKLLTAAGSSLAEFEALHVGRLAGSPTSVDDKLAESGRGWRAALPVPIPLRGTRLSGEWGKTGSLIELHSIYQAAVIGEVDRPAALAGDPDAYALTLVGDAMWPRFRAGRKLLVSPAARVSVGDDVLVRLREGGVLIKELVRTSASAIELRQFNPDVTFAVEAAEIVIVHKVVGEAI